MSEDDTAGSGENGLVAGSHQDASHNHAGWFDGEDDGRCRVIKADGERCKGTRIRRTGMCAGHSGVGGVAADPRAASQAGHAEKRRRSLARATLGITARRAATPLQAARLAAQLRADDYARAVVDAPLDDAQLSTLQRQRAAIDAINVLFPPSTVQLQVEVPDSAADVEQLSWQDMQQLAAQLLGSQE